MNEETHQKLMKIKRSFRLLMSGPTSQSMTQKGLGYKINWGSACCRTAAPFNVKSPISPGPAPTSQTLPAAMFLLLYGHKNFLSINFVS